MKRFLAVLAVAALAMPAMAQTYYFGATADGSFDTYRSTSGPEGYSNGGGGTSVRISKGNQGMGWISFKGAVADNAGPSLAALLAQYPNATATLYMKSANCNIPTGYAANLISLRAGNQGSMVEDSGNGNGFGPGNPANGFIGGTELEAWRGCSPPPPLTTFPSFGNGIYVNDDPNYATGTQGEPWLTPSTRAPNTGATPFKIGPNTMVRYDTGIMTTTSGTNTPTGKYRGYFPDTSDGAGRSYFALEDVLGMFNNNSRNASQASILAAGQIINSNQLTDAAYALAGGVSPRNGQVDSKWFAVAIDNAFLVDMATNAENKAFVFATNTWNGSQNIVGAPSLSNADFWTLNQNTSVAPYLMITVPEPATMILLALGGLALVRRRA